MIRVLEEQKLDAIDAERKKTTFDYFVEDTSMSFLYEIVLQQLQYVFLSHVDPLRHNQPRRPHHTALVHARDSGQTVATKTMAAADAEDSTAKPSLMNLNRPKERSQFFCPVAY